MHSCFIGSCQIVEFYHTPLSLVIIFIIWHIICHTVISSPYVLMQSVPCPWTMCNVSCIQCKTMLKPIRPSDSMHNRLMISNFIFTEYKNLHKIQLKSCSSTVAYVPTPKAYQANTVHINQLCSMIELDFKPRLHLHEWNKYMWLLSSTYTYPRFLTITLIWPKTFQREFIPLGIYYKKSTDKIYSSD